MNIYDRIQIVLGKSWSLPIVKSGQIKGLVSLDISPHYIAGETVGIWLGRIFTPEKYRKNGYARCAVKKFLNELDRLEIDCYLCINPYGKMTYKQLADWYVRLGFQLLDDDEGLYLRKPKKLV